MRDELDADVLRWFAESHTVLEDAQFTERVIGRLRGARPARLSFGTVRSIITAVLSGFVVGVAAPLRLLRLRRAGLVALLAAAVTLWTGPQLP